MSSSELMSIGVFAQRTGLTASALRFYADSGLLRPAEVDPVTGYRYYGRDQFERAVTLRRLREMGVSLEAADTILSAAPAAAARLIDDHVARIVADAATVRRRALALKAALTGATHLPVVEASGPVFAAAVEQVLAATAHEPTMPVLNGLRVEVTRDAVTLTATDRYRLSTRTLVPTDSFVTQWATTVDGDDLRAALNDLRRSASVRIDAAPHGIRFRAGNRDDRHCRSLPDDFPDFRAMLAALPSPTTRVAVPKGRFLGALESRGGEHVLLRVTAQHGLDILPDAEHPIPATVTGQDLAIAFELTTLYPAVGTAIGPDLILELRGTDGPATIRSADHGDLTTLAMPTDPRPFGATPRPGEPR
ncbi:DNA polymerase III subunit beta family protein [Nocardia stercoris]|uniref:MerR family transcriptional regulator n=1 Tax=Nocardia stercoris TaxID=2483361 RepID=A0A3M2KRY4_9NOCA|nr:MerR family transcriptional regulator [Nocardia stercoris]RMI28402.1 MerR family transcriptional regulator [Nocardia stercoris]